MQLIDRDFHRGPQFPGEAANSADASAHDIVRSLNCSNGAKSNEVSLINFIYLFIYYYYYYYYHYYYYDYYYYYYYYYYDHDYFLLIILFFL